MQLISEGTRAKQEAFRFLATLPDFETAVTAVLDLARQCETITSDDVWGLLEQRGGIQHCNTVGAAMNAAALRNIISATGRIAKSTRVSAHGRNVQVWRSLVCEVARG